MEFRLRSKILSCLLLVLFSTCALATPFSDYLDELAAESGYTMSGHTRERLITYYNNSAHAIYGTDLEEKHSNFTTYKEYYIGEWGKYTGNPWPTYTYSTTNRNYGDKFDAHHIIPQSYNGPNEWWNLLPLTSHKHHKAHSNSDSMCFQLFPNSRGGR